MELRFGFYAFGDDLLFKVLGEGNDRLQDLGILTFFTDAVYERAVDLQRIERQPVQIAEARISGTEIVNAELYAEQFQAVEHVDRMFGIFHGCAFGDLEFQAVGIDL